MTISKKIHNFCPMLIKLGENDYLMRQSFSTSFMRIGQKLWIFLLMVNFWVCLFFSYSDLSCYFFVYSLGQIGHRNTFSTSWTGNDKTFFSSLWYSQSSSLNSFINYGKTSQMRGIQRKKVACCSGWCFVSWCLGNP